MHAEEAYNRHKSELVRFFQKYVNEHDLNECVAYYYFLEDHSQADALLFALPMIERYADDFDHDIYDHLGCMVFHDGSNAMLHDLLKAELESQNETAKAYLQTLIETIVDGLQKTAVKGFRYDEAYLQKIRKQLQAKGNNTW